MNNIIDFIQEKLKISSFTKINKLNFTDEELMDDYSKAINAYTKDQKEPLIQKYNVSTGRIKDIQLAILDELRENRKNKTEFTKTDVLFFIKYDVPESYPKYKTYLDKESKDFIEYLLEYYKNRGRNISPYAGKQSIADKYVLKKISYLQKYLKHQ